MTTHFIEVDVDLQDSPLKMQQVIETALQEHGQPLRWAVTAVDTEQQKARVEAIVTTGFVQPEETAAV